MEKMKFLESFENYVDDNKSEYILNKMHLDVINNKEAQHIIRKFLFNEINKRKFIKLMMEYLKSKFDTVATDSEMMDIVYKFIEE